MRLDYENAAAVSVFYWRTQSAQDRSASADPPARRSIRRRCWYSRASRTELRFRQRRWTKARAKAWSWQIFLVRQDWPNCRACRRQTTQQQIGSGGEDKPQLMQRRQKYCATDHPLQSTALAWWPLPVEAHAESVSSSIVVFAHPPVQNGDSRVFDVIVTVIGYGNEKGFPRDRHQSVNVIRSTKGTGSPACIPKNIYLQITLQQPTEITLR